MDLYGGYKEGAGHWAKCSCGKYAVRGSSTGEVIDMITKHYRENKDTHTIGLSGGSYMLHIPPKRKWYQRVFGAHKGTDK